MTFECPVCHKPIISNNQNDMTKSGDLVIRSRLVFMNEDGNVLCRCSDCKNVVALPISFKVEGVKDGTKVIDL